MTSPQAQLHQANLIDDTPFIVPLGKYTFHARYLKSFNDRRVCAMIVESSPNPTADINELIRIMSTQGTLTPKSISRLILGSYWKIRLFHGIFWRWIDYSFSHMQMTEALTVLFEAQGLSFFFQNTTLLVEGMTTLKKRMTKTELKQLSQELLLEKKLVS